MSSLSDQLSRLRSLDAERLSAGPARQPSYLFSAREAASQALSDVHGIGHNGFLALSSKDAARQAEWLQLEEPLFGEAAKYNDRTLLDKEANAKLDSQLERLFELLGPFLPLKASGQILEWCIRRFRIHEFNIRAVFRLFLPYHETPQFAQMLQLLKIEDDPVLASFLPVKRSQQALPRAVLVAQMMKSADLLRFVAMSMQAPRRVASPHRALIAFWTVTLAGYIQQKHAIAPGDMAVFLPSFADAMKEAGEDVKLAAYTIIARLSLKAPLSEEAVELFIDRMCQSRGLASRATENSPRENDEAMLGTLAILCAAQGPLHRFPIKATTALLQIPRVDELIEALNTACDLERVLLPLGRSLVDCARRGSQAHTNLLRSLLHSIGSQDFQTAVCSALCEGLVPNAGDWETCIGLLNIVFQRWPMAYEAAMSQRMQSGTMQELTPVMAQVAGARDAADFIVLGEYGSNHASHRSLALQKLLEVDDAQPQVVREQLLGHLAEKRSDTIQAILQSEITLRAFDAEETLDMASGCFRDPATPRQVLIAWTTFLCGPFADRYPHSIDVIILRVIFPRLLVGKATRKTAASVYQAMVGSALATHDLLARLPDRPLDASANANIVITQSIASAAVASPSALTQRVNYILQNIDLGGSGGLLSRLVLWSLAKAAGSDLSTAVLGHVLLACLTQGICAIDGSATGETITGDLIEAIYAKPGSARTTGRVEACMLIALFKTIHRPAQTIPWLMPHEDTLGTTSDFRKATGLAYQLARAVGDVQTAAILMTILFTALGEDGPMLLLTGAIRQDWPVELRAIALQDAAVLLERIRVSALGVLISINPLLQDSNVVVRHAAVAMLPTISRRCCSGDSMIPSSLYGNSDSIDTIEELEESAAYTQHLVTHAADINLDSSGLATVHGNLQGDLRRKVSLFYLSHANACQDMLRRLKLLETIAQVQSRQNLAASVPLLRNLEETLDRFDDASQRHRYVTLLFRAYEKPSKALNSVEIGPLALLKQYIFSTGSGIIQKQALETLRHFVFSHLEESLQEDFLFSVLSAVATKSTDAAAVHSCAVHLVKSSRVSHRCLAHINDALAPTRDEDSGLAKRRRLTPITNADEMVDVALVLLELFEHLEPLSLLSLVSPLITLCSRLADLPSSESSTYAMQSIIVLLSAIPVDDNSRELLAKSLRAEVIVDVLKRTSSASLAQHALLLISKMTEFVSMQIIPHVMPIFTFVGHNLLRRDDAASLRIIEQTLDSIIPPLVKSARQDSTDRSSLLAALREVISIFTSAAPHMPRHKRIPIFSRLATALGPHDFLGLLCLMLCDPHTTKLSSVGESDSALREGLELPLAVLTSFAPRHQLTALAYVVDQLEILALAQGGNQDQSETAIATSATTRKLDTWLVAFVRFAIESRHLAGKVDSSRAQGFQDVDVGLQELGKKLVFAMSPAQAGSQQIGSIDQLRAALHALISLTSPAVFSEIVLWLADSPSLAVLLNALDILRRRLPLINMAKRSDISPAVHAVLRRISDILSKDGAENARQSPEILQTLAVLVATSIPEEHVALAHIVPVILDLGERPRAHQRVACAVFSCLVAFPPIMGSRLLPVLPRIMTLTSAALKTPASSASDSSKFPVSASHGSTDAHAATQAASYLCLRSLVEALPSFVGPRLAVVLLIALSKPTDGQARDQFLTTVARLVPLSTLSQSMTIVWADVRQASLPSVLAYLDFLHRCVRQAKPADFHDTYRELFRLFLSIFDIRRERERRSAEVESIEPAAVNAFVQFSLKLNDKTFRPLFLRFADWALVDLGTDESGMQQRAVALFAVVDRMLHQLKEIATPYFACVLDPILEALERPTQDPLSFYIWDLVASCLTQALLYGTSTYWAPHRLQRLISPCVGQIARAENLGPSRTSSKAGPLVVQLAVTCIDHDAVLKSLNTSLLGAVRNDDNEAAQIAAIRTLEAVWHALGDVMSIHVPETLPSLLECLEADAPVERAARALVRSMEIQLGESLLDTL